MWLARPVVQYPSFLRRPLRVLAAAGLVLATAPPSDARPQTKEDGRASAKQASADAKPRDGRGKEVARDGRDGKDAAKDAKRGKDGKGKGKKKRRGSVPSGEPDHHHPSLPILSRKITCPEDMVAVAGRVCVDRFEASLVEVQTHEPASPHYPPTLRLGAWSLEKWTKERDEAPEGSLAREMPLPLFPEFQKSSFKVKAMSWPAATPNGYVTGETADAACKASGKRLCSEAEWVTACRGEKQTQFPYGNTFRNDACNVFREDHPAHVLHGEFSYGLSDPRLNLISVDGKPLLRTTGKTESCASRWGDDAIYDMVGNLDEWIDDPEGTFVGGFYARATRSGCDARVRAHPISYFDYSTGVRCCKDPELRAGSPHALTPALAGPIRAPASPG